MRNLKRVVAAVCMVMMIMVMSGCGKNMKDSPYLGTWAATSAEMSGISVGVETVLGGEFTFTLHDNGKCTLSIAGDEEKGKWDETDNGFIIEKEFEMVVDGDTGIMEYSGVTFNFERQ